MLDKTIKIKIEKNDNYLKNLVVNKLLKIRNLKNAKINIFLKNSSYGVLEVREGVVVDLNRCSVRRLILRGGVVKLNKCKIHILKGTGEIYKIKNTTIHYFKRSSIIVHKEKGVNHYIRVNDKLTFNILKVFCRK